MFFTGRFFLFWCAHKKHFIKLFVYMYVSEKQIFFVFNGEIYLFTIKTKKHQQDTIFPADVLHI